MSYLIDKDLPIYLFLEHGTYYVGFNKSMSEWLVIMNGKQIVVDKTLMCPVTSMTLDELRTKHPDLAKTASPHLSRVVVLPPKYYFIPTEVLQNSIDNFLSGLE
ncbi:hypothetical protein HNP86_001931 [Methanococcus maripaludis]|uniref:Uncharacterized protein n=1 Tax=Methanococcus maripaludis TaxID=39152 RepID=A0A7J9NVR0_METMI|nr:hypothetical protein [Methanococcus maripaludis]MBA2851772.1 hypothetical protein [Methanococcus maripaludis]